MSYQRSTRELKIEVLQRCGELTDGTSPYDAIAVSYLNKAQQSLFSGGNVFGFDVGEPWVWAQSKRPILLALTPAYKGAATIVQGSAAGTFSVAPTISLQGRFFRVESREDIYRIATHSANSSNFTLDQPYLANSGTYNFMAFKLDYELKDDSVIIDDSNNKIDFRENSSTTLTATLTNGTYTPASLCAEIKTRMEAVGGQTYTVSFNDLTRKFTIAQGGAYFDLVFASGPNVETSVSETLGYDLIDLQNALTYTSVYAMNGIMRLTRPIAMYREAPMYYQSPRDVGKIFMIDQNTFLREYPLNRLYQDMPDKFCAIEQSKYGLWKIRVNASVLHEDVRAEVNFIPVTRKLVDNEASFPKVPGPFADFLVYAASFFIQSDKSDEKKAESYELARTNLQAMISDARKNSSVAGNDYAKLVPRQGQTRIWGWYNRGTS